MVKNRGTLQSVQKELKPYELLFSKLIHSAGIEYLSDTASKTLARPSGFLCGALVLFVTSLGVLLVCRYLGYDYNYLIGLLGFPVGFVIGIAGEFIQSRLRKRPK
ncbi:MAG TPA: hypothetical protein VFW77_04440 [Candidatus Saccharimonadales bacterium]|nr:hypothetical protein [Candidatus Saccharimonadales bacterium]